MENSKTMDQEKVLSFLDICYDKTLEGITNISPSVEDLAMEYMSKYNDRELACKALIKNQLYKCTTSGFLTGFGGFITMPVTLPANISSVIYVQMRMIAAIAYICGYDLRSDETQTFVYACLAGVSVNMLVKQATIKFGVKYSTGLVKKIPGKALTKINQKVGFRFVTKFGSKGIVNMGKLIPGVGAIIGGSLDYAETKIIANRAYRWFVDEDFSVDNKEIAIDDEAIIEID